MKNMSSVPKNRKHVQEKPNRYRKKVSQKKGPSNKYLLKRINALEGQEELKHDDAYSTNTVDDVGRQFEPMETAQQTSDITRIGNELIAKRGEVQLTLQTVAGTHVTRVRFIVFWDLQSNAETAVDIFTSTSTSTGLLDNITITNKLMSPYNSNCSDRYKILVDKNYVLSGNSSTVLAGMHDIIKLNYHNAKIRYGDGNSTTNLVGRQLCMVLLSNQTAASGLAPTYHFAHRWFYTDP